MALALYRKYRPKKLEDLIGQETTTEILKSLPLRANRFGFEPEVTARIARRQHRVFEMSVSYSWRTYAEGKKIGWRDGISALWCIIRYGLSE